MQLHRPREAIARLMGKAGRGLRARRVRAYRKSPLAEAASTSRAMLLYERGTLIDANAAGWRLVARLGASERLGSLVGRLGGRFPNLADEIASGRSDGRLPAAEGGAGTVTIQRPTGRLRLTFEDTAPGHVLRLDEGGAERVGPPRTAGDGPNVTVDGRVFAAMEAELAELRAACDAAPVPIWRPSAPDGPGWRNAAARTEGIGEGSFDSVEIMRLVPGAAPERVRAADGRWWELQLTGGGRHLTALPADAAVAAETAARGYATALVDTFAQLPIGLAVFAADGRLRTFNPAFTEMTGLDPATLAARPDLRTTFDRLRDGGLVPDHADWAAWTARTARLESDSRRAGYAETWALADGRSWRVSGRPHPGGAVAVLLEDVTMEAELERRFQAELRIGQAIADATPDALAVFAANGTLIASNTAYAALWGTDPRVTLADADIATALATWRRAAEGGGPDLEAGDPAWDELSSRLRSRTPEAWSALVPGPHGRLVCQAAPIAGDAILVRFLPSAAEPGAPAMGMHPGARPDGARAEAVHLPEDESAEGLPVEDERTDGFAENRSAAEEAKEGGANTGGSPSRALAADSELSAGPHSAATVWHGHGAARRPTKGRMTTASAANGCAANGIAADMDEPENNDVNGAGARPILQPRDVRSGVGTLTPRPAA